LHNFVRTTQAAKDSLSQVTCAHEPDMAVLDINMPQLTGLQVLGAIEREELATRVILLSGSATNEQIATADWE
jgi:CheY-like chemotaxis protein